tara:strand:+ start:355 stop:504 length:150 start_codon:yes stop_codon:yes gene_type:complete
MSIEQILEALKQEEELNHKLGRIDDDVWEKIKPRKQSKRKFHCDLGALD